MANQKAPITQARLERYLRAMHKAGCQGRIEIAEHNGVTVSIVVSKASDTADTGDDIDAMIKRMP